MKKAFAFGLAVILAAGMCACGRNSGNTGIAAANDKALETQAAESETAAEEVVTLKIGHVEAEDRSTHQALVQYFQKAVEEKTNGAVKVEIHPNGALGGDTELTEYVTRTEVDGSAASSVPMATDSVSSVSPPSAPFG